MKPMPPPPERTATLEPRTVDPEPEPNDDLPWPADDPRRYEQVAEHARGGLGRVVRAIDHRLRRTVAVKQLLQHDEATEARFVREALITARLEHPGIVPVHEAGRWPNGEPYYVMKLVEGRTLKEVIAATASLRDRLALLPRVIAIADAIAYAHSEGVIHRDLKPSNVIVGNFGETVVVDWGLAIDRTEAAEAAGAVVGTPAYMPPEQARGADVSELADVYALGAILYDVIAGGAPYSDAATDSNVLELVVGGPPTPLPCRIRGVPRELAGIVAKAMARVPADRYPNALAFADDLRRFQTGQLVHAHAYPPWQLARKKLSQHPRLAQLALVGAIALTAFGLRSTSSPPETCSTASHRLVIPKLPQVHVMRLPHGRYVTVAGAHAPVVVEAGS